MAGLAWAVSAEAESLTVACFRAGAVAWDNAWQWWWQQIFHRLCLFCERAQQGQVHGRNWGQWLTHGPALCHLPAFPASKDRLSAQAPTSGALGPWQDLSEVLEGQVCFHAHAVCPDSCPQPGCLCRGSAQWCPARSSPPTSAQHTLGRPVPVRRMQWACVQGDAQFHTQLRPGTAGSSGGLGAWAGLHPPTLNRP